MGIRIFLALFQKGQWLDAYDNRLEARGQCRMALMKWHETLTMTFNSEGIGMSRNVWKGPWGGQVSSCRIHESPPLFL